MTDATTKQAIEKAAGTPASLTPAAYAKYSAALKRYLYRRVRRPEDAPDLLQEIFTLYVHKCRRPEEVRDPLAYLFRLAFHVVGDALDRQKRDPLASASMPTESWVDGPEPRGEHQAEDLAVLTDVLAAIETLPKGYRTALMLVGQGMSYQEAAQASGFTVATIKTYVMHGRAALHRALGERVKDPER